MKKFYMTMVAMLCGVAAMAQNTVYAENIKVEKGATTANLAISMANADDAVALSFRLALPEGVKAKAAKYVTANEERYDMDWVREMAEDDEAAALDFYVLDITSAADGNKMYSLYSNPPHAFLGNDGALFTIPLTLTDVAEGAYEIKLYNISISSPDGVSIASAKDYTCTLQVGEGTGINSINAADSKAPVYNLAGQRVSKAQKGVFIQHGKKVAVK